MTFKQEILQGIPKRLPGLRGLDRIQDASVSHAPRRKMVLTESERVQAVQNALRYFERRHHATLKPEFEMELNTYGRIYMHRFRPTYSMHARPIGEYPAKSKTCAAIMLMIQNNLDPRVAQHPHELITYGGNGAVFQNWAQYLLTMKYLATMSDRQTLVMYSGHPMGVFPSHPDAPRVVVTNGMMIPNYSKPEDWERFNAMGVTQYGQMTAGSFMYIGPQGIVHGTTLTLLNAKRKWFKDHQRIPIFVSSGLGGMSGAQPKAGVIAGVVALVAEINPLATQKRKTQGWVQELFDDPAKACARAYEASARRTPVSIAYQGNIVDLWEYLASSDIPVDLGSDQTSLHNPWAGGYYPADLTFEAAQKMMTEDPGAFKKSVQASLRRQCNAIETLVGRGMTFFDYGNAFLLEASRSGAPISTAPGEFIYPSYVEALMGPLCFDFGFGPFRWVCTSGNPKDLETTDRLAAQVLRSLLNKAPQDIRSQLADNLEWIEHAGEHQMVVGSQARILYADAVGRIEIAKAFNRAIKNKKLKGPIVLGRDHHDVSGTDSPFRETANIRDGSRFTADMAVQNFVGDAVRGASWVSLHNGGGVGWGEAINGGFGLVLDGSLGALKKLESMLFWDVHNGIARRAWAGNPGALASLSRATKACKDLWITPFHGE